jgi:hypothetical protein
MNSAVIRQRREDDRDRQKEIEKDRRQNQDDEDGENADREHDVAALEHGAEGVQRRKLETARGGGGRGSGACSGHVAHVRQTPGQYLPGTWLLEG